MGAHLVSSLLHQLTRIVFWSRFRAHGSPLSPSANRHLLSLANLSCRYFHTDPRVRFTSFILARSRFHNETPVERCKTNKSRMSLLPGILSDRQASNEIMSCRSPSSDQPLFLHHSELSPLNCSMKATLSFIADLPLYDVEKPYELWLPPEQLPEGILIIN
jgi:hypothetical protein